MEPKMASKWRFHVNHNGKFLVTAALFMVIVVVSGGYLVFGEWFYMPEKLGTYFTVVLDCGSTGSRVNVFEWRIENGDFPLLLRSYPRDENKSMSCNYHCLQTEPGLHNFVDDEQRVRTSLEPLIGYAERLVPPERQSETPIFVLATAGMRSLSGETAKQGLENIENVIKDYKFMYRKSWIRVLSGTEEAYYGWVALNFKMGIFRRALGFPTLGMLDIGGSSLQVVAEVNQPVQNGHSFKSKIGAVEHNLVTYSFPYFGFNKAFERTVHILSHTAALVESDTGTLEVRHPCLGSHFVQNYTCDVCFHRVAGSLTNDMIEDKSRNSLLLVGEPNQEQCEEIALLAATNFSSSELSLQHDKSKCVGFFMSDGNITQYLHSSPSYHALSGFFAVYQDLNMSQGSSSLTRLQHSAWKLCSRSMENQNIVTKQRCFQLSYLTSLIENALCLSDVEITFGPGDVSWSLGASLVEGEFIWHRQGNRPYTLQQNANMHLALFASALLLLSLLLFHGMLPLLWKKSIAFCFKFRLFFVL